MNYVLDTNIITAIVKENEDADTDFHRIQGLRIENWLI